MNTQQIADRFYELALAGNWEQIQNELFSKEAKSIEPAHSQGFKTVSGLDKIKEKGKQWEAMVEETYGGSCTKPLVSSNHFTCVMGMDVKMKGQQYVYRSNGKYALTDIYFPQIGLHVEVNEPAHYSSEERIHADDIRRAEIEANTSHTVMSIDCTGNMGAIHAQVDNVVDYVR